jgi:hypothetical protein
MIKVRKIHRFVFICSLFFILFYPVNLFAHKLYVFAWEEGGEIFTESKFSSNKWVQSGKIIVRDENNTIFLTGLTSEKGSFIFTIPESLKSGLKSDLVIELDAGMGHKAYWKLTYDEIFEIDKEENNIEVTTKKHKMIKKPGLVNIISGVLIIFIFFLSVAYYKKKKMNKK